MTGTASPSWKPRAEARKASTEASSGDRHPRRGRASASGPSTRGEGLQRDVGDAEQRAGGGAEDRAVMVGGRAEPGRGDQQHADGEHPDQEGHQRGHRRTRSGSAGARQGQHEQRQAGGGHDHADPLARADLAAEQPLADHREHHDAGRERDLDDATAGRGRARRRAGPTRRRRSPCRSRTSASGTGRGRSAAARAARPAEPARAPRCLHRNPSCVTAAHKQREPDTDVQEDSLLRCPDTRVPCAAAHVIGSGRQRFQRRRCGFSQRRLAVPGTGGARHRANGVQAPTTRGRFAPAHCGPSFLPPQELPTVQDSFAARMGRWSAQHRKKAIFGWIAFVDRLAGRRHRRSASRRPRTSRPTSATRARPTSWSTSTSRRENVESVIVQAPQGRQRSRPRRARGGRRHDRRGLGLARPSTTSSPRTRKGNESQVSKDGRSVLVNFKLRGDETQAEESVGPILAATEQRAGGATRPSTSASSARRARTRRSRRPSRTTSRRPRRSRCRSRC